MQDITPDEVLKSGPEEWTQLIGVRCTTKVSAADNTYCQRISIAGFQMVFISSRLFSIFLCVYNPLARLIHSENSSPLLQVTLGRVKSQQECRSPSTSLLHGISQSNSTGKRDTVHIQLAGDSPTSVATTTI